MDTQKTFFDVERKLTDDSLVAERDKTNRSLSKSRTSTENKIDESVSRGRREADQALDDARTLADSKNEDRQAGSGPNVDAEKRNGQERVARERLRGDNAVELERSQGDAALHRERELKSALASRLLEQERKLTDKNLSFERTQTDSEVLRNSLLLTDEIAEHSKTKISLTTRDEFLAIVSHDLRNPIGAAASCAEMLLEDPQYSNVGPQLQHWIRFIKRNVDVSLRMIADLLDLERIAVGKLHLKLEKHSAAKIIQQSLEIFTLEAAAKKVALRATPLAGSDEVVCDHDRILQILSNLIGNALKCTPEDGVITISASITSAELEISVQDTGPGISQDNLIKIFERFAQVGSNDRKGLGLGLYISKMLIEAHNGRIWAKSKVNEGSTFSFTLPL